MTLLSRDHLMALSALVKFHLGCEGDVIEFVKSEDPATPWASEVYVLETRPNRKRYVYKTRRISPVEFVELETVLTKVQRARLPHLCQIVNFHVTENRLHLLLDHVQGVPLDHYHDHAWNNDPAFLDYLGSLPMTTKINIILQLFHTLESLHAEGLLFQDLKTEQLIIAPNDFLVLIDVDTVVLKDGFCAKQLRWTSRLTKPPKNQCCEANDIFQAGCVAYELFTSQHFGW